MRLDEILTRSYTGASSLNPKRFDWKPMPKFRMNELSTKWGVWHTELVPGYIGGHDTQVGIEIFKINKESIDWKDTEENWGLSVFFDDTGFYRDVDTIDQAKEIANGIEWPPTYINLKAWGFQKDG